MHFFYQLSMYAYTAVVTLAAGWNDKARKTIEGRKNVIEKLKLNTSNFKNDKKIWFHASSVGEFEMARPIIEYVSEKFPQYKIIISFFSPSVYELRKNYHPADYIFYLPFDIGNNAMKVVEVIRPDIVFWIKYDFFEGYFQAIINRKIPFFLVNTLFLKHQPFFKFWGKHQLNLLSNLTCIFVQNENSARLIENKVSSKITVTGDIRVDRVLEIAENVKPIEKIELFLNGKSCIVFGSSWETEESFFIQLIKEQEFKDYKIILVPHEIDEKRIEEIRRQIPDSDRFTQAISPDKRILIVDTVGLLAAIFQYAHVSVIGGGFTTGIHSILEPSAFGSPVIFGPKFAKFIEAKDLIELNFAKSVKNFKEFKESLSLFCEQKNNENLRKKILNYVQKQRGAKDKIIQSIEPHLNSL